MKPPNCDFEARVTHAAKTGKWPDTLRLHAATCKECSDTLKLMSAMNQAMAEIPVPSAMPDYKLIWMKAQVRGKQTHLNRLELLSKLGTLAVGVIVVAFVWIWKSGLLGSNLGHEVPPTDYQWTRLLTATLPYTLTGLSLWLLKIVMHPRPRGRAIF